MKLLLSLILAAILTAGGQVFGQSHHDSLPSLRLPEKPRFGYIPRSHVVPLYRLPVEKKPPVPIQLSGAISSLEIMPPDHMPCMIPMMTHIAPMPVLNLRPTEAMPNGIKKKALPAVPPGN